MIFDPRWRGVAWGLGLLAVASCSGRGGPLASCAALVGAPDEAEDDTAPDVSFVQEALAVGLERANEPASAAACPPPGTGTLSYGTWLVDLDGDGRLDVYDVNHGQGCHVSGLWLGDGAGGFGQNLFTGSVATSATNGADAHLGLSNELSFAGDLNGDGAVDLYFLGWAGLGTICFNQGNHAGVDWTGPTFACQQATEAKAFGDVNGDGRIDVEVLDPATPYDVYRDDCRTLPTVWKLNDGTSSFASWPTDANEHDFVGKAAPGTFLDLDGDGYPDQLQGVEVASDQRGAFETSSGGLRVRLGRPDGTYAQVTSGLEGVTDPVARIEDIDGDGCLDVGTDVTVYRDNQSWYLQDRAGATCLATFHAVARTALPFNPGARHVPLDVDNDGTIDQAVIVHDGYGNNDHLAGGVHIFRRGGDGTYADLGAAGVDIDGTSASEFYADQLSAGDWNDDGRVDLAGAGQPTIPGTDNGIALWTSQLETTNRWLVVRTPTISGFFAGAATIAVYDDGFAGRAEHLVTPTVELRTGRAWSSQAHHFGVGTRASVDVVVTFADGTTTTVAGASTNATVTVSPGDGAPALVAPSPAAATPPPSPPPLDSISALTLTPTIAGTVPLSSFIWSLDGVPVANVTTSPYALTFDLASLGAGPHVVTGLATDVDGRASAAVSMTLGN